MKLNPNLSSLRMRFSYGDRLNPARDWFYLLAIATVMLAASISWNAWTFRTLQEGGVIGDAGPAEAFDSVPVESARALFETRRKEELQYREAYRFVDPSL